MRGADAGGIHAAPSVAHAPCPRCAGEAATVQREATAPGAAPPAADAGTAVRAAEGGGAPLPGELRSFFAPRFGRDLGDVRIHTGATAAAAARAIDARAYTAGRDIVFGADQFQPGTPRGRRLIAHELTHVVQQSGLAEDAPIQRCPTAAEDVAYDAKAAAVKALPQYTGLADKTVANSIMVDAKAKAGCIGLIDQLKVLFTTAEATAAATTTQFQTETATAVAAATVRVGKPREKNRRGLEEAAASGATLVAKAGKFGGGSYLVDARDPLNIVVQAKVLLVKKGTGTDTDVQSIKDMEDAIEKAASTRGYLVDVIFVNAADPQTFRVDVDPSKWETATNWSGGDPKGFAHELHHMMAFELDRYDYTSHATNQRMKVVDRLYWFAKELGKPAGYNDPTSLMASAKNPNDDDACRVAGVPLAACVADRQKVRSAHEAIVKAYKTPDERMLNTILRYGKADPATMMAVLRELFRDVVGDSKEQKRITERVQSKDAFGKKFGELSAAQVAELLAVIK